MTPIVLASGSPRRRALLESLGIELEVAVSEADELLDGEPVHVVLENARRKASEIASRSATGSVIIAADTIVVLGSRILNKPADRDDARRMLRSLSGNTHNVLTGLHVIDAALGRSACGYETTSVTFRALTDAEIDCFVDAVNPLDRAGAYTVDGPGSLLVARYDGCYQNVLGLPIVRLDLLLRELGQSLFDRINPERARFL